MELKECITCGSHSFTDNKCDYCGNQYESTKFYADDNEFKEAFGKTYCDDGAEAYAQDFNDYTNKTEVTEFGFEDTPEGKSLLKIMIWILISIIWFVVCVFVPPLFLITICGLIIWICRKVCKKY